MELRARLVSATGILLASILATTATAPAAGQTGPAELRAETRLAETQSDETRSAETPSPPAPLPPPGEMARCKELIDAGLNGAARARLAPIVEAHPGWARATALLALTYYKESRFEVAATLFARALAADPQEIAARPPYGWSLYSLGRLDEAEEMFESLLAVKPDYTAAHYALGLIDLDRDEIDGARRHLATTLELAVAQDDPPMAGRARARLGDLYLRLDDLPAARRELELALELVPDEGDALFTLSRVLQRLGDEEGAADARRRFEAAKAGPAPGAGRLPG
ncbi:MAG: tetratricopeptide repeat protein [Acidobacteriota bacterium]|nr:tetratricopeptide repeat protein [Acidobacteriota bacterium]MDH3522795.1 tetratricopeptide repeat protein [Acidobacteriota bacterium]